MKKEVFKKLLSAIFAVILFMPALFLLINVNADEIADPNDIFFVSTPTPNQSVKDSINISWRMYDDEQQVVQYSIKLFDRLTCESTPYGDIIPNANGASNANQNNNIGWNTRQTSTTTNLSDGFYCLRVCAAFFDGTIPYSACNEREVIIVNNNRAPIITSQPPANQILENATWQYPVQATDPDGNALSYRLIYTTNFLQINPQTGLISTNSNSKTLPTDVYTATYKLAVEVKDIYGATAVQEFNLVIYKPVPQPTPTPSPTPETNMPSTIEILAPTSQSTFFGQSNTIAWKASDAEGIKRVVLEYSLNSSTWKSIAEVADQSKVQKGEYEWNVSDLEDNSYKIRVTVVDKKDVSSSKVSDTFKIQNKQDPENPSDDSKPLIVNIRPENNSETNNPRPVIYGEFVPSQENTINTESFSIKLDDVDILEKCTLTQEKFSCALDKDLNVGQHKVIAKISDTGSKEAILEWVFSTTPLNIDQSQNGDSIIIFGRAIPRNTLILLIIICLICLVLLLIPWILYILWSRNHKDEEDQVENNVTNYTPFGGYDSNSYLPTTSETTTTYPTFETPTVTTNYYPVPDSAQVDNTLYSQPVEPPVTDDLNQAKIDDTSTATSSSSDISSFEEFMKKYPELASTTSNTQIEAPSSDGVIPTSSAIPDSNINIDTPNNETTNQSDNLKSNNNYADQVDYSQYAEVIPADSAIDNNKAGDSSIDNSNSDSKTEDATYDQPQVIEEPKEDTTSTNTVDDSKSSSEDSNVNSNLIVDDYTSDAYYPQFYEPFEPKTTDSDSKVEGQSNQDSSVSAGLDSGSSVGSEPDSTNNPNSNSTASAESPALSNPSKIIGDININITNPIPNVQQAAIPTVQNSVIPSIPPVQANNYYPMPNINITNAPAPTNSDTTETNATNSAIPAKNNKYTDFSNKVVDSISTPANEAQVSSTSESSSETATQSKTDSSTTDLVSKAIDTNLDTSNDLKQDQASTTSQSLIDVVPPVSNDPIKTNSLQPTIPTLQPVKVEVNVTTSAPNMQAKADEPKDIKKEVLETPSNEELVEKSEREENTPNYLKRSSLTPKSLLSEDSDYKLPSYADLLKSSSKNIEEAPESEETQAENNDSLQDQSNANTSNITDVNEYIKNAAEAIEKAETKVNERSSQESQTGNNRSANAVSPNDITMPATNSTTTSTNIMPNSTTPLVNINIGIPQGVSPSATDDLKQAKDNTTTEDSDSPDHQDNIGTNNVG